VSLYTRVTVVITTTRKRVSLPVVFFRGLWPEYPIIVLREYGRADHEEHGYEESLALARRGIEQAPQAKASISVQLALC
jgi:hypothetical protein